jgi:hypothetical protein
MKFLPIFNPPPEIFYGRHDDIETATALNLRARAARIAILGAGGIGKTSIALTLLHHTKIGQKFGKHRRFISCEGISSIPILVDTMCTAFGLHYPSANQCEDLLVFLHGAYTSYPLLLVLDNFEAVWDVKDAQQAADKFLRALVNVKMLSLVVTMRGAEKPGIDIHWSWVLHVQSLDLVAAQSTFMVISGIEPTDDHQLNELLHAVDCVPLAVTLLARLGQNESPVKLLQRWKNEHTQLLSRPQGRHRLDNLDVSIEISIKSHRMESNPNAQHLLSVVAMLPTGIFPSELESIFPKGIITCKLDQVFPYNSNVVEASTTLREVALAHHTNAGRLDLLSPIRSYMVQHYPPLPKLVESVLAFYLWMVKQGLVHTIGMDHRKTADTLVCSGPNIAAVITQALTQALETGKDKYGHAVQAALHWTTVLYTIYPQKKIIELAVQFVRKWPPHSRLPDCLQSLGNVQAVTAEYIAAQDSFTEAQKSFEASNDQRGAASCLCSLGELQTTLCKYDAAEENLVRAQKAFEALQDKLGVATCLHALGDLQSRLSQYDAAKENLTAAQEAFEALENRHGVATCLRALGGLQHATAEHQTARETFTKARQIFEVIHDSQGVAWCIYSLGDIQRMTSEYKAAQKTLFRGHQ